MNLRLQIISALLLITLLFSCTNPTDGNSRKQIDLGGTWGLILDYNKEVLIGKGGDVIYTDSVLLPGTLDENKKGWENTDITELHLNRKYGFEGAAFYSRKIEIPQSWENKHIELKLERTKVTEVYIDHKPIGSSKLIFTPQLFDVTAYLNPGVHNITIKVDNSKSLVPVEGSHAYSDDTQTNWNGIIGDFYLEASNPHRIEKTKVTSDVAGDAFKIDLELAIDSLEGFSVEVVAVTFNSDQTHTPLRQEFEVTSSNLCVNYKLGEGALLWSEFNPVLYQLYINLKKSNEIVDRQIVTVGFREFKTQGRKFTINGLTTFLRGKHDACVFPLTGYPPMDVEGWVRVMEIAKDYGINHYRFHSWCPPKAAFEAADKCGIYMQSELPIWYGFNSKDSLQRQFMSVTGKEILDVYGNHASFAMFALGNEIFQERSDLKEMIDEFRAYDNRPLYAQGSNNRLWAPLYAEGDDFWVSFRTDVEKEDCSTDIRSSISNLDADQCGIINKMAPSTTFNYSAAMAKSPVPVIGHEIGQYQIYPNYDEMKKYTGVLEPRNFEVFRQRLIDKGMEHQAYDFFKASGALSVICYKADIEAAMRTPDLGGFQILDLQDFPGQGTALVGILDAFMDSKGLVTPEVFRQSCDKSLVLAEMPKYVWQSSESFNANIVIANYEATPLSNIDVNWKLIREDEVVIESGSLSASVQQGEVVSVGQVDISLGSVSKPTKANLILKAYEGNISNTYDLWIYPEVEREITTETIVIASEYNSGVQTELNNGKSVILFPNHDAIKEKSVGGQFIPEFWNYAMFKKFSEQSNKPVSVGTMGLLVDIDHPLFNNFPTEFHSNWQWWHITKNSRPLIFDNFDGSFKPIVQVIDNINRNHKLGLIFEWKVGKGKLLVCMSDLSKSSSDPASIQLYHALFHYASSSDFNPTELVSIDDINRLLK